MFITLFKERKAILSINEEPNKHYKLNKPTKPQYRPTKPQYKPNEPSESILLTNTPHSHHLPVSS